MATREKDPSSPNPFENRIDGSVTILVYIYILMFSIGPTQAAVRRELAQAEAEALAAGRDFALVPNMSPLQFMIRGLDLEAEQ